MAPAPGALQGQLVGLQQLIDTRPGTGLAMATAVHQAPPAGRQPRVRSWPGQRPQDHAKGMMCTQLGQQLPGRPLQPIERSADPPEPWQK